jgi:hypothetical protein
MAARVSSFLADRRGGPLAEMAVLLLPLSLIVAMAIEAGDILWRHQIALKAARDAARYVSRTPLLFDDACDLDPLVLAAATASAKVLAVTGSLDGGPPLIPNWTEANLEVAQPVVLSADPCLALVRAAVSVDLPLPFAPIFRLFNPDQADVLSFSVADQARWLGE